MIRELNTELFWRVAESIILRNGKVILLSRNGCQKFVTLSLLDKKGCSNIVLQGCSNIVTAEILWYLAIIHCTVHIIVLNFIGKLAAVDKYKILYKRFFFLFLHSLYFTFCILLFVSFLKIISLLKKIKTPENNYF